MGKRIKVKRSLPYSVRLDYLTNGGRIEVAQRMAGHSNAKTTGHYDRRDDDVSVGEAERIGI
jgi:integrase/recombinase XerD